MPTRSGPVRIVALVAAVALVTGAAALALWRSAPGVAAPSRGPFPQIPAPDFWHGVTWSSVESPAFREAGTIEGATTDGASIVAWGRGWVLPRERPDPRDGLRNEPEAISLIWRSTDGETWSRSLIAVDHQPAWPTRLALGPAGVAGVAHTAALPGAEGRPALIGSPDGNTWISTAVPLGTDALDVLPTTDGFVAVGRRGERPVTWFVGAAAGAPAELPRVGRGAEIVGGTAVRDGLILVGQLVARGNAQGVLWIGSADGWTVHRAADLFGEDPVDGTMVSSIVPFAGGLFARGWSGVQPACQVDAGATVMTAGPLVADHGEGPGLCDAAWVSPDGVTWKRARMPNVPGGQQGSGAVVAGGDGLLTIADEAQPFEERRRPALWTSGDGIDWRRIGDVPPEAVGLLHAIPGRVLVTGATDDGSRPAVWLGTPAR